MILDLGGYNQDGIITVNIDPKVNPTICCDMVEFFDKIRFQPDLAQKLNQHIPISCEPYYQDINGIISFAGIEEIRLIHSIEHIEVRRVPDLFGACYFLLNRSTAKNPRLVIECPDIALVCKLIMDLVINETKTIEEARKEYHLSDKVSIEQLTMWGLYGNPDMESQMGHKWCYSGNELCKMLRNAGFQVTHICQTQFGHISCRDIRVEAYVRAIR